MATSSLSSDRGIGIGGQFVNGHIFVLQVVTVAWMLVECSVALLSAYRARSVSLLAFGSDSFIELISAIAVILQFVPFLRVSQEKAARFCGTLLFLLAGVVCAIAALGLLRHSQADTSALGVAITAGALCLMPILAHAKRKAADATGNRALRADAVQSATCAYLAALTLAGLVLRYFFAIEWLDQVAALLAVPVLIIEASRARKGQSCACC